MSKKKRQQLGMPIGTATNRLVKALLYSFAQRLRLTTCYRCGQIIERPQDMSIDHKVSWLDSNNPQVLFFDVNNVALSHKTCNSEAGRRGRRITDIDGNIRCYRCRIYLPHNTFSKNASKPFGLNDECKHCDKQRRIKDVS